jgi:hypothetical protein
MQHTTAPNGSDALLRRVRAGFTEGGGSLRAWCIRKGVQPSYAHRVLVGLKNGPAAQELRQTLVNESGVAA